jgi:hypothetical protein
MKIVGYGVKAKVIFDLLATEKNQLILDSFSVTPRFIGNYRRLCEGHNGNPKDHRQPPCKCSIR